MITSRPTLMVVDDEADILVALQDLFEGEYEVRAFTSAGDALQALSREPDVAVIISDQRMPQMSGDAFLAEARRVSDAAAILLTGYADLSAVTAALNRGGIIGYSPKPWDPDALKAMVAGAAEQRRLRRALRYEEGLLRGLMEHLPYAVAIKRPDGRIAQLNEHKARALGHLPQACLGRTEAELGGVTQTAAEAEAMNHRRPVRVVREEPGVAGSIWTQTDCIPLIAQSGEVDALVVLERDITDERRIEQQLRQSDKLRALGTLAGGVAHDFNNLLTAIVGSLELASRRLDNPTAIRRYLDNATLAAQRGAALTKRLLGFSRRTDGEPVVTDLAAAMAGMRDLVARTLGGGVQVSWRIADGLWPSSLEADQLEVAVLNLAVNARDAMPDGGVITIEARNVSLAEAQPASDIPSGDYVVLTVSDTGQGMAPEVLDRILEPFFTTKPVGKGTGLGLPMVYGFAQRSGGGLSVQSELGRGTRISLYLPRAQEGVPAVRAAEFQNHRSSPRARILVIDDEPSIRSVTAACLRDLGHDVLEADSGLEGLALLGSGRAVVDVVLVDYAMPAMNGLEFIDRARALKPSTPVVLLTGYFDVEAVPRDVRLIQKPFTRHTLEAVLSSILAPTPAAP